ncbi:MAG: hypothetical protein IKV53_04705 [Clostridia bacterium]|nr:hypothetical protein [Clostridia bacterium]
MDFKRKLRVRTYVAIAYTVIGILMIIGAAVLKTDDIVSVYGLIFTVFGIARLRNILLIKKDEEKLRRHEIAETDERNVSIINRARSVSFLIYVLLSAVAVIVLSLLDMKDAVQWVSYSVFSLIFIYWISYFVIRKKS